MPLYVMIIVGFVLIASTILIYFKTRSVLFAFFSLLVNMGVLYFLATGGLEKIMNATQQKNPPPRNGSVQTTINHVGHQK